MRPRSQNALDAVDHKVLGDGPIADVVPDTPYIYVVDDAGQLKIAVRGSAGRSGVKHTQLTAGGPAKAAGELQFGPNNVVKLNAQSGRYRRQAAEAIDRVADQLRDLGYTVETVVDPL